MIISFAVRTFGPILLRGGLGGGGGTSSTASGGSSTKDDFDDFDNDSSENDVDENKDKVSISLPTFAPDTPVPANKTEALPKASANIDAPARIDLFDSFDDASTQWLQFFFFSANLCSAIFLKWRIQQKASLDLDLLFILKFPITHKDFI